MNAALTRYGALVESHPTRILAKAILNGAPPEVARPITNAMRIAREACNQKNKGKAGRMHLQVVDILQEAWAVLDLHGPDEELAAMVERAQAWHRAAAGSTPGAARRARGHREPGTPVPPRPGRPRGPQDETAKDLMGITLEEMYEVASQKLGVPVDELKDRYKHLNPGLQRMNLGNRMRAKK